MGCCVSTKSTSTSTKQQKSQSLAKPKSTRSNESRAPPPSFDEESVKEVLSETPKPPPPPPLIKKKIQEQQNVDNNKLIFLDGKKMFKEEEIAEQESLLSETCSLSFNDSVSTSTIKNDEDYNEVNKQKLMKSPATKLQQKNPAFYADSGAKADRFVKSPARRSDQSPAKRNVGGGGGGSVRIVQNREPGSGQVAMRREMRSDRVPNKRDPGESSARRSRSPANNRASVGRSPSGRRMNQSPGRVRRDPNGVGRGVEEKWGSNSSTSYGDTSANESLENPLVSLECFIFL